MSTLTVTDRGVSTRGTAAAGAHHQPSGHRSPFFAGQHVWFIGIGGCGMSGLARLIRNAGATCAGSDSVPSELTDALSRDGIPVTADQQAGRLPEECTLVIASAAIKPDHPEMLAAGDRGIPVLSYAEALGRLQSGFTGISIAGTHGKSTTTAMLAHVLIHAGLDPSFIVGATCAQIGGGSRTGGALVPQTENGTGTFSLAGKPGILLAEACEFNRSFHHHRPTMALINNIEADHLDIYGSLDEIVKAFGEFAQLLPSSREGGRLLIAHEGAHRREVTAGLACEVMTFGFSPWADYQVTYSPSANRVTILRQEAALGSWVLPMPGEHMVLNTAAAAILAHWCGAPWERISEALSTFAGVDRRMQRLGTRTLPGGGQVLVYDDYGHHPTEIESTLRALRDFIRPARLICVFQPHQHSRTRFLLEEFANSFSHADVVIVPHIYFVRDSEIEKTKVSAQDLVDRLRTRGVTAMHLYPFEAIVEQLELLCKGGDLLVIMGAGPVWKVGRQFLAASMSLHAA
ncbi:MAG: UDP-N-acetylmuramate--L-alanine ligase [Phycisphaeraceae bacterium]|nr:MAG: UDP-N-acetylmuramate--L-alanine ligase [Phycisphaeraceae bacterium]